MVFDSSIISFTGLPMNRLLYFESGTDTVFIKNVPGMPKLFIIGTALRNWFAEPSSYVMETAPFFPNCHFVISVCPAGDLEQEEVIVSIRMTFNIAIFFTETVFSILRSVGHKMF